MYYVMGKVATGVATIILTDLIMEKYDVSAKIKDRYSQARTGITRLASQIRFPQGEDKGDSTQAEAQEAPNLTRRQRLDVWRANLENKFYIWEAGLQLRLARRANDKANRKVAFWIAHARYCQSTENEYKRNYVQIVPISYWAGDNVNV